MRFFYDMKSNLYNVFILKCASITNICRGCYYIITKDKTSRKRNTSILWKIALSSFSIVHTKILYMAK